jgi:broad specificity phosphatase PhoE
MQDDTLREQTNNDKHDNQRGRKFIFLRHGQTDWNNGRKFMGRINVPLNQVGEMQAEEAGKKLQKYNISAIISSPLDRALRTAEIVNSYLNVPLIKCVGIQECTWGIMEGKEKGDFTFEKWKDRRFFPRESESVEELQSRVLYTLNDILDEYDMPLIVSHGGVFFAITDAFGQASGTENCVPHLFEKMPTHWSISAF